jgi:hypothetical protein
MITVIQAMTLILTCFALAGLIYLIPKPERLKDEVARREYYLAHKDDLDDWGESQ